MVYKFEEVHIPFLCKTLSLQVTLFYENFQGSHSLYMNKSHFLQQLEVFLKSDLGCLQKFRKKKFKKMTFDIRLIFVIEISLKRLYFHFKNRLEYPNEGHEEKLPKTINQIVSGVSTRIRKIRKYRIKYKYGV